MSLAILYLVLIVGAEFITNFIQPLYGVIAHAIILAGLTVHTSRAVNSSTRNFLLALCLAPLTRIFSFSMPLTWLNLTYWYLIIYPPLFLAAWVVKKYLNLTAKNTGLNAQKLPLQLGIALTGFVFGVVEYYLLKPEPLIPELTWGKVILPAFVLLAGTGFVEEFIFRGVIQRASMTFLGRWGLPYVALVFTSLQLINYSTNPWDIPFIFLIGLFFGWIVNKTGSLLGVALSHGITNITLYLIIPFFPSLLSPLLSKLLS